MNASIREIVGEIGGREAAARLCKVTPDAIKKWDQIGIPAKHWPTIVHHSGGSISYERLAAVNASNVTRHAS